MVAVKEFKTVRIVQVNNVQLIASATSTTAKATCLASSRMIKALNCVLSFLTFVFIAIICAWRVQSLRAKRIQVVTAFIEVFDNQTNWLN